MNIEKTDVEAKAPILWPPDVKSWLIGKDPDAGKDWRQEEKGMTGWDGWMASSTWWTWVWVDSGSWWWTGRPHMLWFMGSQRVGHDWVTELNWTEQCPSSKCQCYLGKTTLLSHTYFVILEVYNGHCYPGLLVTHGPNWEPDCTY